MVVPPAHVRREPADLVDAEAQGQGREVTVLCEVEEVVADRVDALGWARAGPLLEELREFCPQ